MNPLLFGFLNSLTLLTSDITGGNLCPAYDCHRADRGIIRLDETDVTGSSGSKIALPSTFPLTVSLVGGIKVCEDRLRIIRPVSHVRFHHLTTDRTVPAVVTEGIEDSMVNCATNEILGKLVVCQRVYDGVGLSFDPGSITGSDSVRTVSKGGFAHASGDIWISWSSNRSYA